MTTDASAERARPTETISDADALQMMALDADYEWPPHVEQRLLRVAAALRAAEQPAPEKDKKVRCRFPDACKCDEEVAVITRCLYESQNLKGRADAGSGEDKYEGWFRFEWAHAAESNKWRLYKAALVDNERLSSDLSAAREQIAHCPGKGFCAHEIDRLAAERDALSQEVAGLREAAEDALGGWQYIRRNHGDLYGVGWDRVEEKLTAAIRAASLARGE